MSLPGKVAPAKPMSYETSTPSAPKAAPASRMPPAPPSRPNAPPPPPLKPEVPRYKSLFNFDGQDGEMSLKKEDVVEVKEKDDNGAFPFEQGARRREREIKS